MAQRLERLNLGASYVLAAVEEEGAVSRALDHLLRVNPTVVLVASTTAPAGPEDVIGRAMLRVGCHIEKFLAPVEPGNLFLLGYRDDIPVVSAPGCFRSAKTNVVDLVLPPLLARYRVSGWELACLGHGGLLAEQPFATSDRQTRWRGCLLPADSLSLLAILITDANQERPVISALVPTSRAGEAFLLRGRSHDHKAGRDADPGGSRQWPGRLRPRPG
jgi:molybdenum cofactor cytidylyltransferase